jgi:hypothetical protein
MTREFSIMAVLTIGLFVAVLAETAGSAAATTTTSFALQGGSQQALGRVELPIQGSGYMMLAGATIRDHRSCAPNCGPYYPNGAGYHGGGYHGGGRNPQNPPPVSPGNGEGGVTVTPTPGSQRGIPCYGNLC